MFKKLFAFPIEVRPGGWAQWRVRFLPLAVWTCLFNAAMFALVVYFQRPAELLKSTPVPRAGSQTENRRIESRPNSQ